MLVLLHNSSLFHLLSQNSEKSLSANNDESSTINCARLCQAEVDLATTERICNFCKIKKKKLFVNGLGRDCPYNAQPIPFAFSTCSKIPRYQK